MRCLLQPEKHFYRVFIDLGADDAELAGDVSAAVSNVSLARNIVEVDPVAVFAGNDALGAEDHAEVAAVELFEGSLDRSLGEGLRCLKADGIEDFVSVVMTLMVVMVMVMIMVVLMVVFIVIMMMIVIVMIVVMMVFMLILIVVIVIVVVVMGSALFAVAVLIMMMVVMLVLVLFGFEKSGSHVCSRERLFDCLEDLNA